MRLVGPRATTLGLAFLLAVSCRDVRDLLALGNALKEQYPHSQVSVSLTDGLILTLTVADSGLAVGSCESQADVAIRMATFVRGNYGGFDSLQTISVAFASRPSRARETARSVGLPIRFARTLVSAGLTSVDSARAVESCKAWRELQ